MVNVGMLATARPAAGHGLKVGTGVTLKPTVDATALARQMTGLAAISLNYKLKLMGNLASSTLFTRLGREASALMAILSISAKTTECTYQSR